MSRYVSLPIRDLAQKTGLTARQLNPLFEGKIKDNAKDPYALGEISLLVTGRPQESMVVSWQGGFRPLSAKDVAPTRRRILLQTSVHMDTVDGLQAPAGRTRHTIPVGPSFWTNIQIDFVNLNPDDKSGQICALEILGPYEEGALPEPDQTYIVCLPECFCPSQRMRKVHPKWKGLSTTEIMNDLKIF
jgi:hypothetical protein